MQQGRSRCSDAGAGATEGGAGARKKSTVGAGAARLEKVQRGRSRCSKVGADAARSYQVQRGGTRCSEVGVCGARSTKQKIIKTHCPLNSLLQLHRRARK